MIVGYYLSKGTHLVGPLLWPRSSREGNMGSEDDICSEDSVPVLGREKTQVQQSRFLANASIIKVLDLGR